MKISFSDRPMKDKLYFLHVLNVDTKKLRTPKLNLISTTLKMESEKSDKNVKLWIGNLDTKLDEFQLLKILEQFGKISSFDFLYHLNDRGIRTPRGYAFVTYELVTSAMEAINVLHKKKILTKVIYLTMNKIYIQGESKEE